MGIMFKVIAKTMIITTVGLEANSLETMTDSTLYVWNCKTYLENQVS